MYCSVQKCSLSTYFNFNFAYDGLIEYISVSCTLQLQEPYVCINNSLDVSIYAKQVQINMIFNEIDEILWWLLA